MTRLMRQSPVRLGRVMGTVALVGGILFGASGIVQGQALLPPVEWLEGVETADTPENSTGGSTMWEMDEEEYASWFEEDGAVPAQAALSPEESAAHVASVLNAAYQIYLPRTRFEGQLATRLGFGVAFPGRLVDYPEAMTLGAGWYQNWVLSLNPYSPNGIQYVQTIRIHQDLECPIGTDFDRTRCPYVVPHSYSVLSNLNTVRLVTQRFPGTLFIIGNEMDRIDWGVPPQAGAGYVMTGHQDEMLPEVYARAYHDLYHYIKDLDPTAKVAIGGIIQPTPVRLQYLSIVWDAYGREFGQQMPVDVWNTHNFMIREGPNELDEWGAGIPPGVNATMGEFVGQRDANGDRTYHIDMAIFDQQIRAFREWMKARGQQNKPLIVSEYGVLYPNDAIFLNRNLYYSGETFVYDVPEPVVGFMVNTFNYFLNARDCTIGYLADDCRLVQAWNWFSLNGNGGYNQHGRLIDINTGQLTPAGRAFRQFSRDNFMQLARPYPMPD